MITEQTAGFVEVNDIFVPADIWSCFGLSEPDRLTEAHVMILHSSAQLDHGEEFPLEPHLSVVIRTKDGIPSIRQFAATVKEDGAERVVANAPYLDSKQSHLIEIVRVEVAPDQVQLRIVGDVLLGPAGQEERHRVAFYDLAGPMNAHLYRRGARHEFKLSALATRIWQPRRHPGRTYAPFFESGVQRIAGRSDVYHLRMAAEEAEVIADDGVAPIWRLNGVVSEHEQSQLRLDLFAPRSVMDKGRLPAIGKDFRAHAWLTGELVTPGPQMIVRPVSIPTFEETVRPAPDVEPPPLWDLFGDVDDQEYVDELQFTVLEASWPLTWEASDPLLHLMDPLPASEPFCEARVGRGLITCGVRSLSVPDYEQETMNVVSFHPIAKARNDHLIEVDHIEISDDRLHGRIVGWWVDDASPDATRVPLAFYDSYWHLSRQVVRKSDLCRFGLSIIAYSFNPASQQLITIQTPAWLRDQVLADDPVIAKMADKDEIDIDFSEVRLLTPINDEGGRPDEYLFRGQVQTSRKLPAGVIFEDAWEVVIEVMESRTATLAIKVLVTERVLNGMSPPRKGSFVEGTGWMQGHLTAVVRRGRQLSS